MKATSAAATVLAHRPDHATLGCIQGLLISYWHTTPTTPDAKLLALCAETLIERFGALAALHLLHESVELPSSQTRNAFQELNPRFDSKVITIAFGIPTQGFLGSVLRSLVTGLFLALPTQFPISVHGDTTSAAKWLERHLGRQQRIPPLRALQIEYALAQMTAHRGPPLG